MTDHRHLNSQEGALAYYASRGVPCDIWACPNCGEKTFRLGDWSQEDPNEPCIKCQVRLGVANIICSVFDEPEAE